MGISKNGGPGMVHLRNVEDALLWIRFETFRNSSMATGNTKNLQLLQLSSCSRTTVAESPSATSLVQTISGQNTSKDPGTRSNIIKHCQNFHFSYGFPMVFLGFPIFHQSSEATPDFQTPKSMMDWASHAQAPLTELTEPAAEKHNSRRAEPPVQYVGV